ncbi:TIR domain-containing protein [Aeromonas dhakensis]|uniref:TIR domain-containing protein n=1 Tax=Aeromonas dhakensis TaxID=196024 RepID=UPI000E3CBB10|nr:nucleotide-binding protein [Aeromonas dhakensis]RFS25617.1 nucleotide-binding protein [Aeromonas dhakensis]
MALDKVEQKIVEQYFDMRTGYVLHHSNRTFADFFKQFDIDIYNDRYCDIGDSKAKRLRSFFNQHDDEIIGKVILALIEDNDTERDVNTHSKNNELRQSCIDIASRLINSKATAVPSQHRPFVNPFKSQQARAINEIFSAAIPTKPLFVASSHTPSKPKDSQTAPSMITPSIPEKEKIFIVHGHDEHLLIETENLLRKLSLDPIVLRDQHSGGKTIIEKLEIHGDVRYAIILYTACDEGRKIGTPEVNPRARQNVVFEHGYFIGRLGRENVAAVVKGTVEIQGDISGVVYHQYQSGWQLELAKEMKRSGLNVDLNHL